MAGTDPLNQLDILLGESFEAAERRERSAFDAAASPFETRMVLFGAGGFGRRTLVRLRSLGIEPLAFADNNRALWGQSVEGLRVMPPGDAAREFGPNAAFVVTIWNGQATDRMADRLQQLRALGCVRAVPAGLLFWKYPDTFLPYYPLDLPHKVLERAEDVRRAFHLWCDDASRREFVAQVAFRLLLDYAGLSRPTAEEPYFPPYFRCKPDEFLVDCGAFNGDTIRAFLRHAPGFSRVIAFEPDPLNWPRLLTTVSALPEKVRGGITCLRQAVGSARGTVPFDSTGTDLSRVGSGTASVECVTLDEVLAGCEPTLIKFDIEGAEPDALNGGRGVIARSAPILAVSAYHRQGHLWEIPLAITQLCDGYRYGLRPHGAEAWDTVCYAVPPGRWTE